MRNSTLAFLAGAVIVWLFLRQRNNAARGYRGFRTPPDGDAAAPCGCADGGNPAPAGFGE